MSHWIAKREAMNARTGLDAAMAYQVYGARHETLADARRALLHGLAREARYWSTLGMADAVNEHLDAIDHLIEHPDATEVRIGVVRFSCQEIR